MATTTEKRDVSTSPQKPAATPYVEWKLIPRNGKLYGPYPYRRWRDDKGRLRSQYAKDLKGLSPSGSPSRP